MFKLFLFLLLVVFVFFLIVHPRRVPGFSDEEIADAIFQAEGSEHATYYYGIRSVKYKDIDDARRICINTIQNNRVRYAKYGYEKFDSYLEFLASRYAPINCDNDPRGLNKFWLENVRYFLRKGRR